MEVIKINDKLDFIDKENIKVRLLSIKDGELVVANYADLFMLPGGKIDKDESLMDALLREVYEEVGFNIDLDSVEELTSPIWKDTYEKKKKKYHLDLRYAIFNQLLKEIVDPNFIYFDSNDTTESDYFSDFTDKKGKHLECVVYTNEEV